MVGGQPQAGGAAPEDRPAGRPRGMAPSRQAVPVGGTVAAGGPEPAASLAEAVRGIFAPGGILERLLPGYQHRPGQVEMALAVAAALEEGRHLAVEAATGIGKSLAYLVPAALWAHRHKARVVVATHTLTLQDQLRARDLPVLEQIVPVPVAVLKGFGQYACRLQAAALLEQRAAQGPSLWSLEDPPAAETSSPPTPVAPGTAPGTGGPRTARALDGAPAGTDPAATAMPADPFPALAAWLESTPTGELAELTEPGLARLAPRLAVDARACLGSACPALRRCFPLLAREQAHQAALIVTNHALVLADWAGGGHLLPDYDALILDEAHHLEDVAAQQLGCRLNPAELIRALGPAEGPKRTGSIKRTRGPHPHPTGASGGGDGGSSPPAADAGASGEAATRARHALEDVAVALETVAGAAPGGPVRLPAGWNRRPVDAGFKGLTRALERAGEALADLREALDQSLPPVDERAHLAFRRLRQGVQEAGAAIQRLLEDAGLCAWVEPQPGGGLQLAAAPVVAAGALEPLFDRVPTVLASATLPRDDHWLKRLGLEAVERRSIPSPFDLARQALLAVVTDAPRPPSRRDEVYAAALARQLLPLIGAIPGGVLVLFTARWALEAVGERLRPALRAMGRRPALQDRDGPRAQLVADLAAGRLDVLMGVDSLWEGIDVPGRHLEGVILTRIPFDAPGDPLTAARCEAIEQGGGSAFFQYQLPRAAVKLKQGFGRLIRSPADRGVVVVLDPRLAPGSSRYATQLLDSLPPATRWVGSATQVVDVVARWFAEVDA
ncbi:MAG TPA: ATP-dependent DNA helicase [Thermaerobacter sp.]